MFCMFGFVEASRPVDADACRYVVWMRPVLESISGSSASVNPVLSLATSRYSKRLSTIGCASRIFASSAWSVDQPVLIFFVFGSAELLEQDPLELRRGVHVELLAGVIVNLLLVCTHAGAEVFVELLEVVAVDEDARVLHPRENAGERELELDR